MSDLDPRMALLMMSTVCLRMYAVGEVHCSCHGVLSVFIAPAVLTLDYLSRLWEKCTAPWTAMGKCLEILCPAHPLACCLSWHSILSNEMMMYGKLLCVTLMLSCSMLNFLLPNTSPKSMQCISWSINLKILIIIIIILRLLQKGSDECRRRYYSEQPSPGFLSEQTARERALSMASIISNTIEGGHIRALTVANNNWINEEHFF